MVEEKELQNKAAWRFSLKDLVSHCRDDVDDVWARRCLVDAVIPLWFKEDRCPCTTKFYMARFENEEHARLCCRGEAPFETIHVSMEAFERDFPAEAMTTADKKETFLVLLVSGPEFATFLRIPRYSLAFWASVDDLLKFKKMDDQKRFARTWCNGCLKRSTDLKRCKRCQSARYCSAACIKSDWKQHKIHCGALVAKKVDD